jgi:protein gp37
MAVTSIEWTDTTWNPVVGCSIVTAGCTNCYAMRMAARLDAMGLEKYHGLTRKSGGRAKWTGRIRCDEAALSTPMSWRQPRKVFVNSMSDLFHPDVPRRFIKRVWQVMEACPHHMFQVLTKRPERMAEVLSGADFIVLRNVWLGTSVENEAVIARLDDLRRVPAVVRFVSFEPLIGSVTNARLDGIHWAIVGGESGPKARPIDPEWVDEIKELCDEFGAAFFFKQWGGVNKKRTGREYRGRVWNEYPQVSAYNSNKLPCLSMLLAISQKEWASGCLDATASQYSR